VEHFSSDDLKDIWGATGISEFNFDLLQQEWLQVNPKPNPFGDLNIPFPGH